MATSTPVKYYSKVSLASMMVPLVETSEANERKIQSLVVFKGGSSDKQTKYRFSKLKLQTCVKFASTKMSAMYF